MSQIHIKKFIDKLATMESKQSRDVVLSANDARGLRDEISKLLTDFYELSNKMKNDKANEVIQVEIRGGSFK
jgi:hypothetical protein